MKVLLLEPGKNAKTIDISDDLESLQKVVGGWIEPLYFSEKDKVALVCNEEGKINGLIPNRAIEDDEGKLIDIVFGTCFICGLSEDSFASLPDDLLQRYLEKYRYPQDFDIFQKVIFVTPFNPEKGYKYYESKMYNRNA